MGTVHGLVDERQAGSRPARATDGPRQRSPSPRALSTLRWGQLRENWAWKGEPRVPRWPWPAGNTTKSVFFDAGKSSFSGSAGLTRPVRRLPVALAASGVAPSLTLCSGCTFCRRRASPGSRPRPVLENKRLPELLVSQDQLPKCPSLELLLLPLAVGVGSDSIVDLVARVVADTDQRADREALHVAQRVWGLTWRGPIF